MALSVDKEALRRYVERSVHDLPALPPVVAKIVELTDKTDATATELDKLISTDPALVAKVLRAVNSAYYGLSRQVGTTAHAIVILGFRQIQNIVLSMAAMSLLKSRAPNAAKMRLRFWRHSFGAAAAVTLLCEKHKIATVDRDRAAVGALLHDVGVLFLFNSFPDVYGETLQIAERDQAPLEVAEEQCLGLTHPEVGEVLATAWSFPPYLAEVIRNHHGPFTSPVDAALGLVHAADWLSSRAGFPIVDAPYDEMDSRIAEILGIGATDELCERIASKVAGAEELFELL